MNFWNYNTYFAMCKINQRELGGKRKIEMCVLIAWMNRVQHVVEFSIKFQQQKIERVYKNKSSWLSFKTKKNIKKSAYIAIWEYTYIGKVIDQSQYLLKLNTLFENFKF